MSNDKKCKNCFYWNKVSRRYGKCLKLGMPYTLRSFNSEDIVLALTPLSGLCDEHKLKTTTDEKNNN